MKLKGIKRIVSTILCASLLAIAIPVLAQPSPPAPVPSIPIDETAIAQSPSIDNHIASLTAQWLLAISLLMGALAIAIGVYHYNRNENWYRLEFLRKTVKEFEQDPDIWRALKILDFEEYRDYEITHRGQRIIFRVDNDLLCAALAGHEDRIRRQEAIDHIKANGQLDEEILATYQIETTLRDWFNKMLNGLEHFGYFVEAGLFTANEIRPWMIYWIRLIADRAYKRPGASKFYDQLYTYIHEYGFSGVIKLFEKFGYRILPTPYQETDFVDLSKGLKNFDVQTALSLAKASQLIYEDLSYVAEISQRWKIDVKNCFRYFNNKARDTQAFMFKTDTFMVLAFRGSQETKDWQTNFRTKLQKFALKSVMEPLEEDWTPPRGQVHRGFQTAWDSVEASIVRQIRQWNEGRPKLLPLFITGHSLGGALATVAAASLVKRKFNIQGLYTFGQPRVGDIIFAAEIGLLLKGKVHRFVNNNDIVPHVPPPYLPWNPFRIYVHIGKMLYFDFRGNLTLHPNPLFRLLDFSIGLLRDAIEPGFDMINDHRMEYYISHLKKTFEIELEKARLTEEEI
jgi:hypothetical protein